MFCNLNAWFSASVDSYRKQLWKYQRGNESELDRAQFIFSDDSSSPDTQSIFNSQDYENEHLAVFHSQYISECVDAGDRAKVVLGHFFLPPKDITNLVRKEVTFNWDISPPVSKRSRMKMIEPQPRTTSSHYRLRFLDTDETQNSSPEKPSKSAEPAQQLRPDAAEADRSEAVHSSDDHGTAAHGMGTESSKSKQILVPKRPARDHSEGPGHPPSKMRKEISKLSPSSITKAAEKRHTNYRITNSISTTEQTQRSCQTENSANRVNDQKIGGWQGNRDTKAKRTVTEDLRRGVTATDHSKTQQQSKSFAILEEKFRSRILCPATVNTKGVRKTGDTRQGNRPHLSDRGKNSELTDLTVCHISQLMKVMGSDVSDFIPTKNGSQVFKKGVH